MALGVRCLSAAHHSIRTVHAYTASPQPKYLNYEINAGYVLNCKKSAYTGNQQQHCRNKVQY